MYIRKDWPVRLGGFLALVGLVSVILPLFNYQLRWLMWAQPAQPFLGIGLIGIGVALVVVPFVLQKRAPEAAAVEPASAPSGPERVS